MIDSVTDSMYESMSSKPYIATLRLVCVAFVILFPLAFRRDAKNNFVGMDELSSITLDAVKRFARNNSIICIGAFPNTELLKQSARLGLL